VDIVNVPSGGIAATNVQLAIIELDTEKQPKDATLTALAALVTVANRLVYSTGVDAFALTAFTAFARTLLDDSDATTMRGTLGLGNVDNTSDANKPVSTDQATADSAVQAFAIQRDNHTGTQLASTISDFATASDLRVKYFAQGAPTSKAAAATLTGAEVLAGIIEYNGAVANLTMPDGSDIESAVGALAVDRAFEFNVINTGAATVTIATASGLSLVGTMTVTAGVSGMFRVRKTAINTYIVYRVA
jgi:hypothetical protein